MVDDFCCGKLGDPSSVLNGISEGRRLGIVARMKLFPERKNSKLARPPSRIRGFWVEFDVRAKDLSWFKKDSMIEDGMERKNETCSVI